MICLRDVYVHCLTVVVIDCSPQGHIRLGVGHSVTAVAPIWRHSARSVRTVLVWNAASTTTPLRKRCVRKANMYKKIVVGYDGSPRALRAVEEASDLATALGSSIHIVSAVDRDRMHKVGESSDTLFLTDIDIARDQLANIANKMTHLDVSVAAIQGAPAQTLITEAERVNADLILVGNRHVQGLSRVLGSVAEDVAHKANCAVLIAQTRVPAMTP